MRRVLSFVVAGAVLSGCASGVDAPSTNDDVFDVVATTPIVADLARQVAGDRARVTSLMPPGTDPHTYEPGLRSVRDVANADVIFTNGLLLEQQSLVKTVRQSSMPGTPVVELAEQAPRHGERLIPLVENIALDTVWLGLRVDGGANKTDSVRIAVNGVTGPGTAAAYITSTFGVPEVVFNSRDGLDEADSTLLPVDAHTHVSWAFSKPGFYVVSFSASLGDKVVGTMDLTVAVGVDPRLAPGKQDPQVLDSGHMDITADLNQQRMLVRGDAPKGTDTKYDYDPARVVVSIPSTVLQQIPGDPAFRFLGNPGEETYLLPQAVLGKHVHGEVDPHVWHSVPNAIAMVKTIEDELTNADPGGRDTYHANAEVYCERLKKLDGWVRQEIDSIPPVNRHLVTTHDGYGYLGKEYDINIAGFVTPNPAVEPSPRDVIALTRTLENLHVPAVFLEPKLAGRAGVLTETAHTLGLEVCTIRGDTLDAEIPSYEALIRSNTEELVRCLSTEGKRHEK